MNGRPVELGARIAAALLGVLAIAAPLLLADRAGSALADAAGLACLLVGVALWLWVDHRALGRREARLDPMVAQARAAASRIDQLQRRTAELERLGPELQAVKLVINGERHNLSLVATGQAELRGMVDREQLNLGAVAAGLHEIRGLVDSTVAQGDAIHVRTAEFASMMEAAHAHLAAMSDRVQATATNLDEERRNLGLVAGGLDALRRQVIGVERFDARQAAFADLLVEVADRVDALAQPAPTPAKVADEPGPEAPDRNAVEA